MGRYLHHLLPVLILTVIFCRLMKDMQGFLIERMKLGATREAAE